MLVLFLFYVISAFASFLASICIEHRLLKKWFIFTIIALLSGAVFCVPMTKRIISNLSSPNFWAIFAVLSLVAWQLALIFNNRKNVLNYEFSFLLLSFTLCIFCSSFFHSNYLGHCYDTHATTETFSIVTTIDGSESGESIFGDGYVVERMIDLYSNNSFYQYYIQLENGDIKPQEIPEYAVSIIFIEETESPYIEIVTTRECMGYRKDTLEHILTYTDKTYTLYIPEGSVKSLFQSN